MRIKGCPPPSVHTGWTGAWAWPWSFLAETGKSPGTVLEAEGGGSGSGPPPQTSQCHEELAHSKIQSTGDLLWPVWMLAELVQLHMGVLTCSQPHPSLLAGGMG